MGSTPKMPRLQADRVYGHAAPDRMHQRDKMDDDQTLGTRARKSLVQPKKSQARVRKEGRKGAAPR